jgi:hypothetical protein
MANELKVIHVTLSEAVEAIKSLGTMIIIADDYSNKFTNKKSSDGYKEAKTEFYDLKNQCKKICMKCEEILIRIPENTNNKSLIVVKNEINNILKEQQKTVKELDNIEEFVML